MLRFAMNLCLAIAFVSALWACTHPNPPTLTIENGGITIPPSVNHVHIKADGTVVLERIDK